MTKNEIVHDWLNRSSNRMGLYTIGYEKEVYEFIIATCECHPFGIGDVVYNVNGYYQKIILVNAIKINH